jgi:hypothetical protein
MVSGDIINVNLAIYTNDHPSTNASGVDSMDLNTLCNKGAISSYVDSSCMSSRTHLNTIVDHMCDMFCFHDHNASISSSCLPTNNVEENKHSMGQEQVMDRDSRFASSSSGSNKCLMAREENVISSTHPPIVTPCHHKLKNIDMLINDDDGTAHDKLMKFCASTRGVSRSMFKYLMVLIYEKEEAIIELNTLCEEEDRKSNLLEQELEIDKESIAILTQSNEMYDLKVKNLKNLDDKCKNANATNSSFCEASILKENVELKAQLELLTSNYRKLEENHEKLLGSHGDILVPYNGLQLAHEAIITMVTSCEPHLDNSTTSTQNDILPCANPCISSTHNIATSCDELLALPCCSNNEVYTSSSTCVDTNHVEEIKELKAQVTSLEKDLEKCHKGKSTLDNILSVPKSPNDKSGLGFNSNNSNKSKSNKNKGQYQVTNLAKIVCFKCKI